METTLIDDSEQRLGELLVSAGKLSTRDLERALAAQNELGGTLAVVLTSLGLVSEIDVVETRSHQLGVPYVPAESFPETIPDVEGLQRGFLSNYLSTPSAWSTIDWKLQWLCPMIAMR